MVSAVPWMAGQSFNTFANGTTGRAGGVRKTFKTHTNFFLAKSYSNLEAGCSEPVLCLF